MTQKIPHLMTAHGHTRQDDYYWMCERENPAVHAFLESENRRVDKSLEHVENLKDELFEEIKGRIKDDDSTVPYRDGSDYFYSRFEEGKEYALYCRRRGDLEAPEEVMLDANVIAEGQPYFSLRAHKVSPDGQYLAFSFDTRGRRFYTIRFKHLASGQLLDDVIENVTGAFAWAADSRTILYGRQDPDTLRSCEILRHQMGAPISEDVQVYFEPDETFYASVTGCKSKRYIFIMSRATLTTEYHLVDTLDPTAKPKLFLKRREGHEYHIDHKGDEFYILSNHKAANFRLFRTGARNYSESNWLEILAHRDDTYIENFELFDDFLVIEERHQGLVRIQIRPNRGEPHYLDFGEATYLAYLGFNFCFDTDSLRFGYTSMTTPTSVYSYNMKTHEKRLLKRTEVLGDFNPENYRTERVFATASDGVDVPISIVYRIDQFKPGHNPCMVYGYGSYGHSIDANFSSARLSMLDRGFVWAICHIRGGQEMGREWYDQGRLLHKKNTFTDFIACAEHLAEAQFGKRDRLYAMGGSAGGLLMGAVMNMRPDLFHGVVSQVPFVDVVTTMLDDTLPLTTGEYSEWGNPNDKAYYDYILSYSPYDNVEAKDYPHTLVLTGFHDSQVQYWEPAKWVAKLRELKTDDNLLLFKTDMEVGHSGASGRFQQFEETALIFAFLLDLAKED